MSLGDADAKFPSQSSNDATPPSPSRENPGQVYPKSDPKAAPKHSIPGTGGERQPSAPVGNPFALRGALAQLDEALNNVISTLEAEEGSMGSATNEQAIMQKFKAWRMELDHMRSGVWRVTPGAAGHGTPQEGGLFAD